MQSKTPLYADNINLISLDPNRNPIVDKFKKFLSIFKNNFPAHINKAISDNKNLASEDLQLIKQFIKKLLFWKPGQQLLIYVDNKLLPFIGSQKGCVDKIKIAGPSDVAIIGKWPGKEEISKLSSFVGYSGKLIKDYLSLANINYENCYITNLIKVPVDKSTLPKGWLDAFAYLLLIELAIIAKPKFILCLGREVAVTLLKIKNFEQIVDKVHEFKFLELSAELMACAHPAIIFHEPSAEDGIIKTINEFGKLISGDYKPFDPFNLKVNLITNINQLTNLALELSKLPKYDLAFDLEWSGTSTSDPNAFIRCINLAFKPDEAHIIILNKQDRNPVIEINEESLNLLERIFLGNGKQEINLIAHNAKEDLAWLINKLDRRLGNKIADTFTTNLDYSVILKERPNYFKIINNGIVKGFDTLLMAHSIKEDRFSYSLKQLAKTYCGIGNYSFAIESKLKEINEEDAKSGFDAIPDEMLYGNSQYPSYCGWDAVATFQLFQKLTKILKSPIRKYQGGDALAVSHSVIRALMDMQQIGILIDKERWEELHSVLKSTYQEKESELKKLIQFEDFNINSPYHCRALLFGKDFALNSSYNGVCLNLTPVLPSVKVNKEWSELVKKEPEKIGTVYLPSTGKETIKLLLAEQVNPGSLQEKVLSLMLGLRYIGQLLKTVLADKPNNASLKHHVNPHTGRIHALFHPTKETGRYSVSKPSLQNLSNKQEEFYKKYLGNYYKWPVRSIICAEDGYRLVEVDIIGAEIGMAAIQSLDHLMIQHYQKSCLPASDPNYLDMHSQIAIKAFNLTVPYKILKPLLNKYNMTMVSPQDENIPVEIPANKHILKELGLGYFRDLSKTIVFGLFYCRSDQATYRTFREEGFDVTLDQVRNVRNYIFSEYKKLNKYFEYIREIIEKQGYVINCFGRIRRFQKDIMQIDKEFKEKCIREGINFCIQSGVADFVSIFLHQMHYYKNKLNNDKFRIILQIHDSLLFEVKEDFIDNFKNLIKEVIGGIHVFSVDCATGEIAGNKSYMLGHEIKIYKKHWGEE